MSDAVVGGGSIEGQSIMRLMRCVCLASALCLTSMAAPTPMASAQSAGDDGIRAALLGEQEFVETLAEITPEMLRLQKELVETLRGSLDEAKRATQMGQRPQGISDVEQSYYRELEALEVMTARLKNKSISGKEILKIKISVRSDALDSLRRHAALLRQQYAAGVVGPDAVAAAKARALKAEIILMAMKQAAGE